MIISIKNEWKKTQDTTQKSYFIVFFVVTEIYILGCFFVFNWIFLDKFLLNYSALMEKHSLFCQMVLNVFCCEIIANYNKLIDE